MTIEGRRVGGLIEARRGNIGDMEADLSLIKVLFDLFIILDILILFVSTCTLVH